MWWWCIRRAANTIAELVSGETARSADAVRFFRQRFDPSPSMELFKADTGATSSTSVQGCGPVGPGDDAGT